MGGLIDIGDTELFVEERGTGPALIVLHGGPGADHTQLKPYLQCLDDEFRLVFVDQRSQGRSLRTRQETWTFEQNARDVTLLAEALALTDYALLGHSYGALVTLIHAIAYPGAAKARVVSQGVPSARWYRLEQELERLEPSELRPVIKDAWRELDEVEDPSRMGELVSQQMAFHFKDPNDPRVVSVGEQVAAMIHTPDVHRVMSEREVTGFDIEHELSEVIGPNLGHRWSARSSVSRGGIGVSWRRTSTVLNWSSSRTAVTSAMSKRTRRMWRRFACSCVDV